MINNRRKTKMVSNSWCAEIHEKINQLKYEKHLSANHSHITLNVYCLKCTNGEQRWERWGFCLYSLNHWNVYISQKSNAIPIVLKLGDAPKWNKISIRQSEKRSFQIPGPNGGKKNLMQWCTQCSSWRAHCETDKADWKRFQTIYLHVLLPIPNAITYSAFYSKFPFMIQLQSFIGELHFELSDKKLNIEQQLGLSFSLNNFFIRKHIHSSGSSKVQIKAREKNRIEKIFGQHWNIYCKSRNLNESL